MEVHRQVMQARREDEDVQLRQQQDEEYAEGLARDQERARERRPEMEAPPLDEAHLTMASEFLRAAPREGRERDPVRLVLPLGTAGG